MFSALDDTLPRFLGQLVDGFQERGLQGGGRMHEQVDFHRPSGCNFASFKRFYAEVANEIQQFVALVEAHVFILCIGRLPGGLESSEAILAQYAAR